MVASDTDSLGMYELMHGDEGPWERPSEYQVALPDGGKGVEALGDGPREPLGLDLLLQVAGRHVNGQG